MFLTSEGYTNKQTMEGTAMMDKKLFENFINKIFDLDGEQIGLLKIRMNTVKEIEAQKLKGTLVIGDRVMAAGGRKLNGDKGTIVKVNRTRAQVRLDNDTRIWNIPLTMLNKI
jgi:hypothetical protein